MEAGKDLRKASMPRQFGGGQTPIEEDSSREGEVKHTRPYQDIATMRYINLRAELRKAGLSERGRKADLVRRVEKLRSINSTNRRSSAGLQRLEYVNIDNPFESLISINGKGVMKMNKQQQTVERRKASRSRNKAKRQLERLTKKKQTRDELRNKEISNGTRDPLEATSSLSESDSSEY